MSTVKLSCSGASCERSDTMAKVRSAISQVYEQGYLLNGSFENGNHGSDAIAQVNKMGRKFAGIAYYNPGDQTNFLEGDSNAFNLYFDAHKIISIKKIGDGNAYSLRAEHSNKYGMIFAHLLCNELKSRKVRFNWSGDIGYPIEVRSS